VKILVTGAAGFIASHVADAYVNAGHEVVILDDLSRGAMRNVNPNARFYQCDIRDRAGVENIVASEKPAIVNHHAAQMDVRRGVREPLFDAQVNIIGSLNLIEASLAHGVKRFIYAATAGAGYGEPKQMPVPEDYPINPITPYGISKHTIEHYLFTFQFLYGLSYVVLRYGNVYGPRQNSQGEAGVFAIFCKQMLASIQPVIYGDGKKLRDYVYISDVVAANVAALERGSNEIFNISSGLTTADLEVFQTVRQLLGKQVEPTYVARRPGEIDNICLDISKAKSVLGWQPRVKLAEGADLAVAYFQREMSSKDTSEVHASAL
jgi:UDP-glucose 4-epimerase